jgi:hypothetical protein
MSIPLYIHEYIVILSRVVLLQHELLGYFKILGSLCLGRVVNFASTAV